MISSDKFDSAREQNPAIHQLEKPDQRAFNALFYKASIYIFFVFFLNANDLFHCTLNLYSPTLSPNNEIPKENFPYQSPYHSSPEDNEAAPIQC